MYSLAFFLEIDMARKETKPFAWSFERRFMTRIAKDENGCWNWIGAKMRNGYGQLAVGGQHWAAHRYAYTELRGEIPVGLDLDHLCRNRACCNPDHLEPVTRSENLKRGETGAWAKEHNGGKTHCPSGHQYDEANTYLHPSGRRCCRACARERAADKRRAA